MMLEANYLRLLTEKMMHEAEDTMTVPASDGAVDFRATSENSDIVFGGKLKQQGNEIAFELSIDMPRVIKHYITNNQYKNLDQEKLQEASDKLQNALKQIAADFSQSLQNKMEGYGLIEGEQ